MVCWLSRGREIYGIEMLKYCGKLDFSNGEKLPNKFIFCIFVVFSAFSSFGYK